MNRFPSKFNSLAALRNLGVEIGTVLDVGVHEQTSELIAAFGDRHHLLFEPVNDLYPKIRENYSSVSHEIVEVGVSDCDGQAYLATYFQDNGDIRHSEITTTKSRDDLQTVPIVRLDTFMSKRGEAKPYLLKIDVDSVERQILEGCAGIWEDIAVVIVEATQQTLPERLNFLTARGFKLFDLVDMVYYYGVFHQADLVMVSPKVMQLETMRPWETRPYDWTKSAHVAMHDMSGVQSRTKKRTGNLRYAVQHSSAEPQRLQEEWQTVETGQREWRDIAIAIVPDLPPRER